MRKKIQWKGQDDEEIAEKLANDPELKAIYDRDHLSDPLQKITLVPQDIRTFVIYYYKPKSEAHFHHHSLLERIQEKVGFIQ